jgi:malic enzyme
MFLGLSAGNVLSADMLLAMADNPVVLRQIQFLK